MKKAAALSILVAFVLLADAVTAGAQHPKHIPVIGYVSGTGDYSNPGATVESFRQGLQDLGYQEGKNIVVEYHHGRRRMIPGLVAELVQRKVDIIVATNLNATLAAKQATKTIPIVVRLVVDPVAMGIVESLARPGGNITGLTTITRELSAKRLELLREVVPELSHVGVLWHAGAPEPSSGFKEYEAAAHALKIPLESLAVRGREPDFEGVFRAAAEAHVNGLIVMQPALTGHRRRILYFAIKNRLPSVFEASTWVDDGGLMSYAANVADGYRRMAYYIDRILNGAKAANLPIERPTKFELHINLKTAKQIGVTIPQWTLMKADRVIK